MWKRQKSGSVLCPSCGLLVGVRDSKCMNCGRRNPGVVGFNPLLKILGRDMGFVPIVLWTCGILYIATVAMEIDPNGLKPGLSALSPSTKSLYLFGASGAIPVFKLGRWWTVLSAAWLHGGLLHIFFNMMWVRSLGPMASELFGNSRMVIIYTVSGITGFLLSSIAGATSFLPGGAGITVGASAPIFGLLAALVFYGRNVGSSYVGRQAWTWSIILFVFGLLMPMVDNWAHLGGFLGGYAASEWLNPQHPERGNHQFLAVACVAATFLAIIASVVFGLRDFRVG